MSARCRLALATEFARIFGPLSWVSNSVSVIVLLFIHTCPVFRVHFTGYLLTLIDMYCTMYNETWASSYATNYVSVIYMLSYICFSNPQKGDYDGSDRYTVSDSYSYSLADDPSSSSS